MSSLLTPSFSLNLNLLDPIRYLSPKEEMARACQNQDEFVRRIQTIIESFLKYKDHPLVRKKINYCVDYLKADHPKDCEKCHTVAALYAFNQIQNPRYKTKICNLSLHKSLKQMKKCPFVHPGEFLHNIPLNTYEIYCPLAARSVNSSNSIHHDVKLSLSQESSSYAVSFAPKRPYLPISNVVLPSNLIPSQTFSLFIQVGWLVLPPKSSPAFLSAMSLAPNPNSQLIEQYEKCISSQNAGSQKEGSFEGSLGGQKRDPNMSEIQNFSSSVDCSLVDNELVDSILRLAGVGN